MPESGQPAQSRPWTTIAAEIAAILSLVVAVITLIVALVAGGPLTSPEGDAAHQPPTTTVSTPRITSPSPTPTNPPKDKENEARQPGPMERIRQFARDQTGWPFVGWTGAILLAILLVGLACRFLNLSGSVPVVLGITFAVGWIWLFEPYLSTPGDILLVVAFVVTGSIGVLLTELE